MKKQLLLAACVSAVTMAGFTGIEIAAAQNETPTFGWYEEDGKKYWYEDGVRQGVKYNEDGSIDESYRGKEIYDPQTDAWYWLDNIQHGAVAVSKDVYQESDAGLWGDYMDENEVRCGKWVRYDEKGQMIKGWQKTKDGTYYFDETFGTMAKGFATIDKKEYYFNKNTGVLEYEVGTVPEKGWMTIDGADFWYENYVRQGYSVDAEYRGKEIYDEESDAWYWLDNVQDGAKAVSKDVYQESYAGEYGEILDYEVIEVDGERVRVPVRQEYGKWVRYDEEGHMVKGWVQDGANTYYFDPTYGTMVKGEIIIDGKYCYFNRCSGAGAHNRFLDTGKEASTETIFYNSDTGEWYTVQGGYRIVYWYVNGVRQGTEGQGEIIYNPVSEAWYWLDAEHEGRLTCCEDVYVEMEDGTGKWIYTDSDGAIWKGWQQVSPVKDEETGEIFPVCARYFDEVTGARVHGTVEINGRTHTFDEETGLLLDEETGKPYVIKREEYDYYWTDQHAWYTPAYIFGISDDKWK